MTEASELDGPDVPARAAAARARFRAETPANYRPWLHLATPFVFGGAVIAACISGLEGPALSNMIVVPIMWVVSIASEWRLHRDLLHKRAWPLRILYDLHTVSHHTMYVEGAMAIASPREFRSILFPPWALPLLAVIITPLALGLWRLFGGDVARLFVATAMLYVMVYEALHLTFHLPPGHPLRRVPGIEALSRHHERHHNPRRMQRYNFGVTSALWDRIRGTVANDP